MSDEQYERDDFPFDEWKRRIEMLLAPLSPEQREEALKRLRLEHMRRYGALMPMLSKDEPGADWTSIVKSHPRLEV